MLYTDTLPSHSLEILKGISPLLAAEGFYHAGGTALALRMGHRVSVDLDFFYPHVFDPEVVTGIIKEDVGEEPHVFQQTSGSVCMTLVETKIKLFYYDYPQLEDVEMIEDEVSQLS